MSRYLLQKSESDPLWWVLTDTEEQIVCRFKEGEFNETQQFTTLNDISNYNVDSLPSIVNNMAIWLRENHYEIIFMSPQLITEQGRRRIGEIIREARLQQGLSIRGLAKIVGMSKNNVERIEAGKYNYTIDSLSIIAAALGLRRIDLE